MHPLTSGALNFGLNGSWDISLVQEDAS